MVFGLAVFFSFNSFISDDRKIENQRPAIENKKSPATDSSQQNVTQIKEGDDFSGAVVTYSSIGFSPTKITLRANTTGSGCLIRVVNSSLWPLLLRLSPYSDKDNIGFPYSSISPKDSMIIDPRFRIERVAFHSREKPDDEFSVELGEGCSLD